MISAALFKEAQPYVPADPKPLQKGLDSWNFSHLETKGNVSALIWVPYIWSSIVSCFSLSMCKEEGGKKKELPHVVGPTYHWHHHKMTTLPPPCCCIITTEMVLRPLFSAFRLAIFVKPVMISKSCISTKRDVFTKRKNQIWKPWSVFSGALKIIIYSAADKLNLPAFTPVVSLPNETEDLTLYCFCGQLRAKQTFHKFGLVLELKIFLIASKTLPECLDLSGDL